MRASTLKGTGAKMMKNMTIAICFDGMSSLGTAIKTTHDAVGRGKVTVNKPLPSSPKFAPITTLADFIEVLLAPKLILVLVFRVWVAWASSV